MNVFLLVSIGIAVLAFGVAISLLIATRRSLKNRDIVTQGKYPQGYWMSIGISMGVAIGAALGTIFDNMGVGMGVGIAIGAGIGASLERRNKGSLRPLTLQEQRLQKRGIAIGLAVSLVLGVLLLIVLFLQAR